jgi:hypothetical protein
MMAASHPADPWTAIALALFGLLLVAFWSVSRPPKSWPQDGSNAGALIEWLRHR